MKFNKWTLGLAAVASLALFTPSKSAAQANYVPAQGIYIDGTTNTVVNAGGTAYWANSVNAAATNYFNLSGVNGSQTDTNLWPKLGLTTGREQGANSITIGIQDQFRAMTTDAEATSFIQQWAISTDGSHWQTNPVPFTLTYSPNGTSYIQTSTNYNSGEFPFMTLMCQYNTNMTVAITNHWIGSSSGKPRP